MKGRKLAFACVLVGVSQLFGQFFWQAPGIPSGPKLAWGADDPSLWTVKVVSIENQHHTKMTGSGLIFSHSGKAYVLSSEHVAYHSNIEATHQIEHPELGWLNAKHLASDWGWGLELLEVESPEAAQHAPELDGIKPFAGATDQEIPVDALIYGYAAGSETSLSVPIARLRRSTPEETTIPSPQFMWLLPDAYGEYGMSGGPTFLASGELVGINSHQRVEGGKNDILLVTGQDALDWVKRYFRDPAHFEITLARDVNFQMESEWQVNQSSEMMFDFYRGSGFNGGIETSVGISTYGNRSDANAFYDNPAADIRRIIDQIRIYAQEKPEVIFGASVIGFRHRKSEWVSQRWEISAGIPDFSSFFRLLQNPDLEPVVLTRLNFWDKEIEKLMNQGRDLDNALRAGWGDRPPLHGELSQLADLLSEESRAFESARLWQVVKPRDVRELLDDPRYAEDWKKLNGAARIRSQLEQIQKQLSRLVMD